MLKWLAGSARNIGKPIEAKVYTNGMANSDIKVYHVDEYWNGKKANNYIISFPETDSLKKLKYITLDIQQKIVGRPAATSKYDYDIILGSLYQSEVGAHFTDFKDEIKGYAFDPLITFNENQLTFNIPPGQLMFDSLRIEID
jgi:hypothetical protein